MKALALAAAGCLLAVAAAAQRPPLQEQQPSLQSPIAPTAPLAQPQPQLPASPDPQAATLDAPPAAPPQLWLPAGAAKLQALDKINGQATNFTVKVGQSAAFDSLTILVRACVVRPPDRPADAAAFVDVTDSHLDSAGFKGWLLANEPAASMMQNPIYDLRVAGCA